MANLIGLKNKRCVPCEGGAVPLLSETEVNRLCKQVSWEPLRDRRECFGEAQMPSDSDLLRCACGPPSSPCLLAPACSARGGGWRRRARGWTASLMSGKCGTSWPGSTCSKGGWVGRWACVPGSLQGRRIIIKAAAPTQLRCGDFSHQACRRRRSAPPLPPARCCRIAAVAEAEGHHPDLHLTGFNCVVAQLSTHAAKGLTENDFIVAAKVRHGCYWWWWRVGGGEGAPVVLRSDSCAPLIGMADGGAADSWRQACRAPRVLRVFAAPADQRDRDVRPAAQAQGQVLGVMRSGAVRVCPREPSHLRLAPHALHSRSV